MNKKAFLNALEKELITLEVQDITNIIEYYDEYIEDKIENGAKEKDVINQISMYDIIKEVKVHKKINDAVAKPTLSNGIKALIAFLGILSFPMLISVGAVIFAILITISALIFSLIVTMCALFIAGIACLIAFLGAMILGNLPISTAFFGMGISLILIGLFSILVKWSFVISKDMIIWIINLIKNKFNKRQGGKTNE